MRLLLACLASTALAQQFPTPFNTGNDVGKKPMAASEAVKQITLPPGFQATLFASEPEVQNPIACAWDARGRLWVAENYTYADRETNFDQKLRDRILIFEDTDHDGKADKRTVFCENLQNLTSLELGNGGVYVTTAPTLSFIPDRNGDDRPDGPPEALLDGFDAWNVRHNMVNGLKWGPDGWLYGRHGIQATSKVGAPGTPDAERVTLNCGIWRFHPTRKRFEVVCWGGTNSWGHDWNDEGEGFFINTVIGHLYHIIPGAHYERMYGQDLNPHIYQLLPQTADHYHFDTSKSWTESRDGKANDLGGGHAHSGCMIYQGSNWPDEYQGKLFTINLHGRRLNVERLEPQGSGYVGKREPDMIFFQDPWFRGVELTCGPDGGVYVLDWSDDGECHENDGVHRESGRIYKITYGTPKPANLGPKGDLAALSTEELNNLAVNETESWKIRMIQRILRDRGVLKPSEENLDTDPKVAAATEKFIKLLEKPESAAAAMVGIKSVPNRLAGENSVLSGPPSKRRQVLPAYWMSPAVEKAFVLQGFLSFEEDNRDRLLPELYWSYFEPSISSPLTPLGEWCCEMVYDGKIDLMRRNAMRRVASDRKMGESRLNLLLRLGTERFEEGKAGHLLTGLSEALRGSNRSPKPEAWDAFAARAGQVAALADPVRRLNVIFGDGRALDEIRALVLNGKTDFPARKQGLESLAAANPPDLRATLEAACKDGDLLPHALVALARFEDAGPMIVAQYGRVRADGRPPVMAALCSRPAFARALLEAIAAGKIPRADLTAYAARQIASLGDADVSRRLTDVWGSLGSSSEQKKARIAELKKELTADTLKGADLAKGREVFTQVCAACHTLYDLGQQGTNLGPNLTGSGRSNLDYLLENIVDPSSVVPVDYKLSTVTLKDGRVLSGFVAAQNEQTLTLRTMTETQALPRSEIAKSESSAQSLMPEALLDPLTPEQRRDLIAFLMKK